MKHISLPIIHLNGTSAESLLEGYRNAMEKIRDACKALEQIEVHPRDYYVSTDVQAFEKAKNEMTARWKSLNEVHEELVEVAVYLNDIIIEKESRNKV